MSEQPDLQRCEKCGDNEGVDANGLCLSDNCLKIACECTFPVSTAEAGEGQDSNAEEECPACGAHIVVGGNLMECAARCGWFIERGVGRDSNNAAQNSGGVGVEALTEELVREGNRVAALCAHCGMPLYHGANEELLVHASGLGTCRNSLGVHGAERVESAALCLLLSEECRAVTLTGADYWAIPRETYDELRHVLGDARNAH